MFCIFIKETGKVGSHRKDLNDTVLILILGNLTNGNGKNLPFRDIIGKKHEYNRGFVDVFTLCVAVRYLLTVKLYFFFRTIYFQFVSAFWFPSF